MGVSLGNILNSYATGSVFGYEYVGGITAGIYAGTVTNSYADCNVSGYRYVGGLLGASYGATVTACYFTGSVTGEDYVGGLIGDMTLGGDISNCYSTGDVDGTDDVGGLIGSGSTVDVDSSFYCQPPDNGLGTFISEEDMKLKSTYTDAGWDFTNIWGIDEDGIINEGFPYLLNNMP